MKGKRMIAGILLVGIMSVTLTGCKNTDNMKEEPEKPVIILGSDNYPPYNYLNEDGIPTGIDVELATEAFGRMGYLISACFGNTTNYVTMHFLVLLGFAMGDS